MASELLEGKRREVLAHLFSFPFPGRFGSDCISLPTSIILLKVLR